MKVQLKGRVVFDRKYLGKELYACFQDKRTNMWYLYPHDELFNQMTTKFTGKIWTDEGIIANRKNNSVGYT